MSLIAIDYDPLPFTQGTIVAADASKRTFDWKVESGYAEPTEGYLGLQFGAGGAATGRGLGFRESVDGVERNHVDVMLKFLVACRRGQHYRHRFLRHHQGREERP